MLSASRMPITMRFFLRGVARYDGMMGMMSMMGMMKVVKGMLGMMGMMSVI